METNDNKSTAGDKSINNTLRQTGFPTYMLTDRDSYICNLHFDHYFDLFVVIEDLIEISLHTLYNSKSENSGFVRHPTRNLVSVLQLVKQLLPGDTGQTLQELNDYLNAKKEELLSKSNSDNNK